MKKQTLDFDAFMAEKNAEYVTVTVYGKPYRVQREIPAMMPIMMARANEDTTAEEAGLAVLRCGDVLFGREAIDLFCAKGMSAEDMSLLIQKTFRLISGEDVDGDGLADEVLADDAGKTAVKRRNAAKK